MGKINAGVCVLGAIAVVGGGGAIAVATVPSIQNAAFSAVMSPQKYYTYLETKNLENFANKTKENYEKIINLTNSATENKGYSNSLELSVSEKFLTDLGLPVIKPIELKTNVYTSGKNAQTDITVNYDSNKIVTAEAIVKDEQTVYLRIPELMDKYASTSLSELTGSESDTSKKIPELKDLLTPEESAELVKKYGNIFLESLEDNEFTKTMNEDGTTSISFKTTRKEIATTSKKIIETIKEDETLIRVYNEYYQYLQEADMSLPAWSELFTDMLNEIDETINESTDQQLAEIAIIVNKNGEIIGRSASLVETGSIDDSVSNSESTFGYINTVDDTGYINKYYINTKEDDELTSMVFTNKYVVNGDKKDGSLTISYTDPETKETSLIINYTGSKCNDNFVWGNYTFDTSSLTSIDEDFPNIGVSFDFDADPTREYQKFMIGVDYQNDKLFNIAMSNEAVQWKDIIDVPETDTVSFDNIEEAINPEKLTNWMQEISTISNIQELIDAISNDNNSSLDYNDYNSYDENYNDYNNDYNWDDTYNNYSDENYYNDYNNTDYTSDNSFYSNETDSNDYNNFFNTEDFSNTNDNGNMNIETTFTEDEAQPQISFASSFEPLYFGTSTIPISLVVDNIAEYESYTVTYKLNDGTESQIYTAESTGTAQQLDFSLTFEQGSYDLQFAIINNSNGMRNMVTQTILVE